jgi:undecaprenyl-diphosphatase
LFAFVVVISGWLAAEGLKVIFGTLRPYAALEGVKLLFQNPPESFAFPSGHAAFMFSGAFVVWLFEKKWGIFFTICALIVGICRVVSGIHWPLDILGGALLGAVVFLILYEIARVLRPKLFLKN